MTTQRIRLAPIGRDGKGNDLALYADVDVELAPDLTVARKTLEQVRVAVDGDGGEVDFVRTILNEQPTVGAVKAAAFESYVEALCEARDQLDDLGITWPEKATITTGQEPK